MNRRDTNLSLLDDLQALRAHRAKRALRSQINPHDVREKCLRKKLSKWSKMKSTIANKLNLPGGPPAVTQLQKAPTLPKRSPTLRSTSSVVSESFFLKRILTKNPSLRDPAKEEPETQVGMEPAPLPDPVEVPVFEWYDLQTIRYDGGDVLICQRWDFEVSRRIFFLFAINRYEVIYVYRPSTYHSLARIEVDRTLNLY
ncbi:uncharacterized protein [Bemisia tabaci]|uniref:uncharacterized protein n=1 Tax=Bemisia tabaci TaxID=7038 RepID=UPI003B28A5AD